MNKASGHEELEHTADVSLLVWASDWPGLFEEAARGMFDLLNNQVNELELEETTFSISAGQDLESNLVILLSELLYQSEVTGLDFHSFDLQLSGDKLLVKVEGHPVLSRGKDIKAVTFSELSIVSTGRGVETKLVFDV